MTAQKYVTVRELADLLGVSRITIYKRVKKGLIPATKIGKTYLITDQAVAEVLGKKVTEEGKARIDAAVHRTVQEYGEVLKQLGKE